MTARCFFCGIAFAGGTLWHIDFCRREYFDLLKALRRHEEAVRRERLLQEERRRNALVHDGVVKSGPI